MDQRARNEIVNLLLEVEVEEIQGMRHVIASVTEHLQQLLSGSKARLVRYYDIYTLVYAWTFGTYTALHTY